MAKEFFNEQQQKQIISAIKDAEMNTSGEIQVHIERKCKKDVLDRATEVFGLLQMHKTEKRNGVLFYLAIDDHKFAILGDQGINTIVGTNYWENIKDHMQGRFRKGEFTEGLCDGITMAGQQLKKHFPFGSGDVNELSDDISFGKE